MSQVLDLTMAITGSVLCLQVNIKVSLVAVCVFKAKAAVPAAVFSSPEVRIRRASQSAVGERGFHWWGSLSLMQCVD